MKRLFGIVLVLILVLGLAACSTQTEQQPQESQQPAEPVTVTELPTVLNTMEYTLYTNIFYNEMGGDYLGKTITKTGTFATIRDSFNGVTRYYVWGYLDETKCCDWQWEFVPKDPSQLPANGSFVQMTGVFAEDEAALDGYWFIDAEVEVQKIYAGPDVDVDMGTMSSTLERVQLLNMQYFPDDYTGQSLRLYARVAGMDSLEHPYYDGAWQQPVTAEKALPAIGTLVLVTGDWSSDGVIQAKTVEKTDAY